MLRSSVARGTSCNDEKLAMVTDVCNFSNEGTYDFGNVVTAMVDPTHFMIPVGWADPIPTFVVSFSDTVAAKWPAPVRPSRPQRSRRPQLRRTSRCAGVQDSGVEVIGLVTFTKPLFMVVEVSFTIFEVDQAALVVVSFTTGDVLESLATAPTCFDSTDTSKMSRVSPRRRCITALTGETMSPRLPHESRCMSEQLRVRCETRRQSLDIVRCRDPRLLRCVLSLTGLKSAPKSRHVHECR